MQFYESFMLQLLESQYRYAYFTTRFAQRGYGKTIALQQLLKDVYALYHAEQSKRISIKWVNPVLYLKGVKTT